MEVEGQAIELLLTQDVNERETVVECYAHEETGEGEEAERGRHGRDDAGDGADQIAQDQGRNPSVTVGYKTEDNATHDTAAEENRLCQWRITALVTNPIVLHTIK